MGSCNRYYVAVYQEKVDKKSLASYAVRTPDPKQEHPPYGQLIAIEWQIPASLLGENPFIEFDANFSNSTAKRYVFPINDRRGFVTLRVLDDEYIETGGTFSYRARIRTEDGALFREWRHQLFVHLITIEDE